MSSRDELIWWLDNAEGSLIRSLGDPITTIYNALYDTHWWLVSTRQWLYSTWRGLWDWAPQLLAPVTDWLRDGIWDWGFGPIVDTIVSWSQWPLDTLNSLWNATEYQWYPAGNVAYWIRQAANVVLVAYDALSGDVSYVWRLLQSGVNGLQDWAWGWITFLDGQRYWAEWWITELTNVRLPQLGLDLWNLRVLVDSWQATLAPFVADPVEYVWSRLVGTLQERVRSYLQTIW